MTQSIISCWSQPPGIRKKAYLCPTKSWSTKAWCGKLPKYVPIHSQLDVELRNYDYLQVRSRPWTDNRLIKEHPSATSIFIEGYSDLEQFSSSIFGEAFHVSFRYITLPKKMHHVKKAWIQPLLINKRTLRVHQDSAALGVGSWIVVQYLSSCKTILNRGYLWLCSLK